MGEKKKKLEFNRFSEVGPVLLLAWSFVNQKIAFSFDIFTLSAMKDSFKKDE
jgi:hypothetical protein